MATRAEVAGKSGDDRSDDRSAGDESQGSPRSLSLKRAVELARILQEGRSREQARQGLMLAGAAVVVFAAVSALADLYTHPALGGSLLVIRALDGVVGLAALVLARTTAVQHRWKELALGLLLTLMVIATAGQVVCGDGTGLGLMLLMCAIGASVLFPWGWRWQAVVNAAALVSLLGAQSLCHRPDKEWVYLLIALLGVALLSQLNALYASGYRRGALGKFRDLGESVWGGPGPAADLWLVNGTRDGLVSTLDDRCVIRSLSPWAVATLGYAPQELIGVHVRDLLHPEDLEQAGTAFAHALQTPGDAAFAEFRFRHRNGSWRELESVFQATQDIFWNKRVLVFARDITERKQGARELAESEARFRGIFETSPDAIFVVRLRDQRILDANPAFCQLSGFSREQARGWTPLQLNLWADFSQREAFYAALETRGYLHDYEVLLRSKAGRLVPALCSAVRSLWEGEPCVITIVHDITDIKRAEAELRLSEAKSRQVFDSSLDAIVIVNFDDGKLIDVNGEFLREAGLTREQVLGKTAGQLKFWLDPREKAEFVRKLRAEGQVRNFEAAVITKDGATAQHLLNATVVELGSQRRVILISRDITPLKRAQQELIEARERALTASSAKSEFLSNMSHEIRTPLNAILGAAELLAESALSTEQRGHLGVLRANSAALLDLVNDVLDLAKIESRQLSLEHISFNLEETTDAVMRAMALRAREKGLDLAARIAPGTPLYLRGDPSRLRQVLTNLIGNAIKFTERGEVVLEVGYEPQAGEGATLSFAVRDTGIGIAEDKLGDIFRAFTQADSSTMRKYGGSGLGLAISGRLATAMGGRIWARSEPGKGSTFYFTANFELEPALAQTPAKALPRLPASLSRASSPPLRILLAEDSSDNLLVITTFLKDLPLQLDVAENGEAAVNRFVAADYDLVLMDMQMPVMDGYAATRMIRKWERERGRHPCRILAITACALRSEVEKSLAAGCNAHLTKPITKATLRQAIEEIAALLGDEGKAATHGDSAPSVTAEAAISTIRCAS